MFIYVRKVQYNELKRNLKKNNNNKLSQMLRLQQFYNIFTTNHGWLVIIGSSLNLVLKLLF